MQIFNQIAMMLTVICISHNLYFIMALVYGVIRTGEKCNLFKTRHVDYFSALRLIRQMFPVKEMWDIIVPNRLQTLETFRLFLRVRNTI